MKVIRAYKPWSNGISFWRFVQICGGHFQRRWRNGRRVLPYLIDLDDDWLDCWRYSLDGNAASDRW